MCVFFPKSRVPENVYPTPVNYLETSYPTFVFIVFSEGPE